MDMCSFPANTVINQYMGVLVNKANLHLDLNVTILCIVFARLLPRLKCAFQINGLAYFAKFNLCLVTMRKRQATDLKLYYLTTGKFTWLI